MKFSKIVIALVMVLGMQYACAMKVPMDIQVRANTALARLGRMTFATEAERTDGLNMIRVLNDFGKKYPEYAQKAQMWQERINDVKSNKIVIDKKTGTVKPVVAVKPIEQQQNNQPKQGGGLAVIPKEMKEKSPEEIDAEQRALYLENTIEALNRLVAKRAVSGHLEEEEKSEAQEMLNRLSNATMQLKKFPTSITKKDFKNMHDRYSNALLTPNMPIINPTIEPIILPKVVQEEMNNNNTKKQQESGSLKGESEGTKPAAGLSEQKRVENLKGITNRLSDLVTVASDTRLSELQAKDAQGLINNLADPVYQKEYLPTENASDFYKNLAEENKKKLFERMPEKQPITSVQPENPISEDQRKSNYESMSDKLIAFKFIMQENHKLNPSQIQEAQQIINDFKNADYQNKYFPKDHTKDFYIKRANETSEYLFGKTTEQQQEPIKSDFTTKFPTLIKDLLNDSGQNSKWHTNLNSKKSELNRAQKKEIETLCKLENKTEAIQIINKIQSTGTNLKDKKEDLIKIINEIK